MLPNWFMQWYGHNRGIKLVSLLIAVLVWLWASSQIYIRTSMLVPVTLRLPEGMVARSISPPRAQVILEVPRELGRGKDKRLRRVISANRLAPCPAPAMARRRRCDQQDRIASCARKLLARAPSRVNGATPLGFQQDASGRPFCDGAWAP